ncbi:MAG TPA: hypothetical protein VFR85_02730 [Anaeromyxobacteraceae bacterium]|nr:hypothetical protein [Anaeromyxobacteraceae bacterium]
MSAETATTDPAAAGPLKEGLERFLARDLAGAHAAFGRAHRATPRDPQAMSWHGLTLVLVERNLTLGALYCDEALREEGPEPVLLLNQARVQLFLGHRWRAVQAVTRGLELSPQEPSLRAALEALGWRRRPVFPFLARGNPLNVWLGKLRHRWRKRARPREPLSAATLGLPPATAPES